MTSDDMLTVNLASITNHDEIRGGVIGDASVWKPFERDALGLGRLPRPMITGTCPGCWPVVGVLD
jgi:hypothetical protein